MEKRVVSNAVLCILCIKQIHGNRTKMKKVTLSSAHHFICKRCKDLEEGSWIGGKTALTAKVRIG